MQGENHISTTSRNMANFSGPYLIWDGLMQSGKLRCCLTSPHFTLFFETLGCGQTPQCKNCSVTAGGTKLWVQGIDPASKLPRFQSNQASLVCGFTSQIQRPHNMHILHIPPLQRIHCQDCNSRHHRTPPKVQSPYPKMSELFLQHKGDHNNRCF